MLWLHERLYEYYQAYCKFTESMPTFNFNFPNQMFRSQLAYSAATILNHHSLSKSFHLEYGSTKI